MSGVKADKMPGLMGKRKLTTMQVAKQLSTGQSSKEIATPRQVGARNDRRAWRWINQVATKMWGRDLQERVSSLVLAVAGEASPGLSYCLVSPGGHESPSLRGTVVPKQSRRGMRLPRPFSGARNDNTDYLCPRNTLHRESNGRSWAMNNTSNLPGVE